MCSRGTPLVRPSIGDILKGETIDRLHLLFLWDFRGAVFSAPCIHGEKCLQHRNDFKIALPFTLELEEDTGELKEGNNRISSALPIKAIREAGISFVNTNEKYWV